MEGARSLTVLGRPTGKARPRFRRDGRVYTPSATTAVEDEIGWAWIAAHGKTPSESALRVTVTAFFKRRPGDGASFPTKRPDADNVAKIVLDSLNSLAWVDDAQVTTATVSKRWGEPERLEIMVEEELP